MTVSIHILYYALFGLTLVAYRRDRSPVRRDILAVFASMAASIGVRDLQALVPAVPTAATTFATLALLAEPYLCLRWKPRLTSVVADRNSPTGPLAGPRVMGPARRPVTRLPRPSVGCAARGA